MNKYKKLFEEVISFNELKGAVEFTPKNFAFCLTFYLKDTDIYRNTSSGEEGYLKVRPRNALNELRFARNGYDELGDIIEDFGFGNISLFDAITKLGASNKFFVKEIK